MKIVNPADPKRIAKAIRDSTYSQRDIAAKMRVSDVTISNYVSGWRRPSAGNLAKLADVLGMDIHDLLKDGTE